MKNKIVAVAVAGVLASFNGTAVAEDAYQGSMYVVPTVGYMHTDSDLKADNDVAYGVRLGKAISQHWDVQIGLTHSKADEDSNTYTGGDYKQTLFNLDALYMFSRDKFRPFVLAGVGAARNRLDYNGGGNPQGSNTSLMGNIGAGFQYFFTNNIGMQADLRHVWSNAEARTIFGTGRHDETVGNTYFNLGLVFNFGAPKQAAVAEVRPEPAASVSTLPEIAPTEDEALPVLSDPSMQAVVYGPDKPAFEKLTLQAEVLFDFDKSVLKSEGKKILDVEVTEKMKAHPEVELVLISGHTDRIGDDKYNQKLSERRAESVKKYLMSQGIAENRLHTVGKGETQPVEDCKGVRGKKLVECLQPNRRVVVEIEVQRILQK